MWMGWQHGAVAKKLQFSQSSAMPQLHILGTCMYIGAKLAGAAGADAPVVFFGLVVS